MDDDRYIQTVCSEKQRIIDYKAMVIAYYDRVTDCYRERWGDSFHLPVITGISTLSEAIASIERRVAIEGRFSANTRVLDIGCGIGGPTLHIAALTGAQFVGVNLVPQQIDIARCRALDLGLQDRVQFQVGDAMDLAFKDESFDGVIVFESGCHTPDKLAFYRECARVLRPGGHFLGIDWMATAGLSETDICRYIEPICRLHGIPGLIGVDSFKAHTQDVGLSLEALEDLTSCSGLAQMPVTSAPDWDVVFSRGLPPVQQLLSLGGAALAIAARAGAFVLCYWRSRRI
jgi:sterol 24-C-methyltransferase